MATTKGIHSHKIFRLGKAAAKRDKRNFKFAALLKAGPPLPPAYDFDTTHTGIPTPMFANDALGCCVISGRAHQTLRFERIEQNSDLMITDSDIKKEYFKETGGPDSGLVVLDSLSLWRHKGWKVGKHTYKIQAYAEVDRSADEAISQAIFADVGVGIGVSLPKSAQNEMQTGQPWAITTGPGSAPNSWGGHYVFVCGYTPAGPVCITWGRKQQMTWAWFHKYCDEAYAIFDAKNKFKKAIIDGGKLKSLLQTVSKA